MFYICFCVLLQILNQSPVIHIQTNNTSAHKRGSFVVLVYINSTVSDAYNPDLSNYICLHFEYLFRYLQRCLSINQYMGCIGLQLFILRNRKGFIFFEYSHSFIEPTKPISMLNLFELFPLRNWTNNSKTDISYPDFSKAVCGY